MSWYSIALFLHIVGALLLFVLLTIEGVTLRAGTGAARLNRVLGPATLVLIVIPGFYMVFTDTGWTAWVIVGLAAYALIAAVGTYTGISVLRGRMARSAAVVSWLARAGMAVGVVFDMTVKPDLLVSVLAVVIATAGAAALGRPALRALRPA